MDEDYVKRLLHLGTSNNSSNMLSPRPGDDVICSDRLIPCRATSDYHKKFAMLRGGFQNSSRSIKSNEIHLETSKDLYSCLLKNELLGTEFENVRNPLENQDSYVLNDSVHNIFSYQMKPQSVVNGAASQYSVSPISSKSQKLLTSPRSVVRNISRVPYKVLDAPEIEDDFYLNLVDWSLLNVLGVGLGSSVYLWSATTSQVTHLCDISSFNGTVTSVSWSEDGRLLAVGTNLGNIYLWDVESNKPVSILVGHTARVGVLAWNGDILSSGSYDQCILQKDIRTPPLFPERKLIGHKQEVCGLKWSPDGKHLASGGNDNDLLVWNFNSKMPMQVYKKHLAAVKGIAWSPHHHGLLVSGGGTLDRSICFWNTLTTQHLQTVNTGSQVCNLAWSKHSSELVSTHGFAENQIIVWKYPSLAQVAKLVGHSYRVLYLAMSPDGESIVTGAGDETLRFWKIFNKTHRSDKGTKSALNLFSSIR